MVSLELPSHQSEIEPRVGADQFQCIDKVPLLRGSEVEPQQRFGRRRLHRRAEDNGVAGIGEREILGRCAGIQDVDLDIRLLELGMERADAHQLEPGRERLVDLVLARRIDERVHVDRHARPDVER